MSLLIGYCTLPAQRRRPQYMRLAIETLRVNAEGTRQLLELARQKGARFMLASTSEVYGDPLVHPQTEAYWGNVNPVGPRSMYDEGKRYSEAMTTAFHRTHKLPIRICRIFNTYGPRMDPSDGRIVSNLVTQAIAGEPLTIYGDGHQTRSFQYIDDLVEGVIRLMNAELSTPINLGNPVEHSMIELATLVMTLTGSQGPLEFQALPEDDPKRRKPDISLARKMLDWEPNVTLEDGLKRTINSFRLAKDPWRTPA